MEEIFSVIIRILPIVLVLGIVWMLFCAWRNWMLSGPPYVVEDEDEGAHVKHISMLDRNDWWPEDPASPEHHLYYPSRDHYN